MEINFSFLGNILFNLNLSDILFTFIIGNTTSLKKLNLEYHDFKLSEIPIKAKILFGLYLDFK